jgi:hypothetical protein
MDLELLKQVTARLQPSEQIRDELITLEFNPSFQFQMPQK